MKRFGKPGRFIVLYFVMGIISSAYVPASWPADGSLVCGATGDQKAPAIVPDGAGGAIITWHDSRSGYPDIYAQRVDSLGTAKWTADGVAVCTALNEQWTPKLVPDGAGGAIITWYDGRGLDYEVYAQRVDSLGTVKWSAEGVAVCTTAYYRERPEIGSDGAGGAIIAWSDYRDAFAHIYAQRLDSSAVVRLVTDGVAVCTTAGDQHFPQLISDGACGAIIAWQDDRGGYSSVYAQRLDSLGLAVWNAEGVAVCTAVNGQWNPQIASDGAGGAFVAWQDDRSGYLNIYAQRVDSSGALKWSPDGVAIRTGTGDQESHQVVSDGAGGAIIAWQDSLGGNWDIYAQRLDSLGTSKWAIGGVAVCSTAAEQQYPRLVCDGARGAIIAWQDYRNTNYDIYAQHVDSSGMVDWTANGVAVCTAPDSQESPQLVCDGAGGALVTWQDRRNGDYDIYSQRVRADGVTDVVFAFAEASVEQGHVTLSWRVTVDVPESSFLIRRSQKPEWDFVTLQVDVSRETGSLFTCTDYSALPGSTYWYSIVLVGPSGEEESSYPIEVQVPAVPTAYKVYQSYPNPFNPSCTIRYELPEAGRVSLRVLDLTGSVVRTLVHAWREQGVYGEVWDGRSDDGNELPSGVYFYSLKAGKFVTAHKLVLLK